MRTPDESRVNRYRPEWMWLVVFVGLLLYIGKGIQPRLLYYGFGVFTAYPVFSWQGDSLRTAFSTPGGTVNALATILTQTYRDPLAGTLVVAAAVGAVGAGVRRLLRSIQADRLRDLAWAPAILALMIYTRYDDPLAVLLGLGLSIWMAVLYLSAPVKTAPARAGLFLVLFTLGYYLAGASILVFACTLCLVEAVVSRRIAAAVVLGALAIGGAFGVGNLFGLDPAGICKVGAPWDLSRNPDLSSFSRVVVAILYALPPFFVLIAVAGKSLHAGRSPRRKAAPGRREGIPFTGIGVVVRVLVVTAAAALSLGFTRNHIRDERLLHCYTQRRDWDRAVELAHRMRGGSAFTRSAVFDIDRALAHRGRLGEEMCAYPQDETKTLFLSFDDMAGRLQHAKLLELYLDLGCPNAAQKNAYELLDREGPSPYLLEALVRIHLVKGEYESARVVWGALRQYAGSQAYIQEWRDAVAGPAQAENHPLIQGWRQARGAKDQAVAGVSFEPLLKRLLGEIPSHRLAFEYLMAHYLLKHQRKDFVSCLPLLKPLGYSRLPREYTEAVLVYCLENRMSPETLGWAIDPQIDEQFRRMGGIVKNARGNNHAAFDLLAPHYGDTYTFYSMFNVCGAR